MPRRDDGQTDDGVSNLPMIHVYMLEGRTGDQKRRIIEGMTNAMVDVCGSKVERVGVIIHELPAENWGRGGAPMSDEILATNGALGSDPRLTAGSPAIDGGRLTR